MGDMKMTARQGLAQPEVDDSVGAGSLARQAVRRPIDQQLTAAIRERYDRGARLFDVMEAGVEALRFARWRKMQWAKVAGPLVLEVGVGTGKNLPYYPPSARMTAVDFSARMLAKARRRAAKLGSQVRLIEMDVQSMDFADSSFDAVVSSFVFCSVPDPVLGLREVERVCKPGGQVIMLEHVLSANAILGWLMKTVSPIMVKMSGANMDRRTVENVAASGLVVERVTDLAGDIVKLIEARKKL